MPLLATTTCLLYLLVSPQQPETAAPEATVIVSGQVVDLRGEGIPVAEVWTQDPNNGDKLLRRTMTDAEGYFRLSRVPVASRYWIHARAEGRTQGAASARGSNPTTTIELHDATTVQGQRCAGAERMGNVTDATGSW